MTSITMPQGGSDSITYQASTVGGLNQTPNVFQTVKQITQNDGSGNNATTSYSYAEGKFWYISNIDRKFSGFGKVTETDPAGNQTINYFHGGQNTYPSLGEYSDDYYKAGKAFRVEKYNSSNSLYSVDVNKWDGYNLSTGREFVRLLQNTTFAYDGSSSHTDSAESYSYDNSTGNQTQKINWGQVLANNDGSFTDTGTDKFTTNTAYTSNSSTNIFSLPSDITVVDQNNNKVKESQYFYDNQPAGAVNIGNLTQENDWKSGSSYAVTQKAYDGTYGLVTQVKDPDGNATNYAYDPYNLYPATVTNAKNQITSYSYDYASGQISEATDPNNVALQTSYDGFGRKLSESEPDSLNYSNQVNKNTYAYTDTSE